MPASPSFSITDSDDDDDSDSDSSLEIALPPAKVDGSQTPTEDGHTEEGSHAEGAVIQPAMRIDVDVAPEVNEETGWTALATAPRSPVESASRTVRCVILIRGSSC